MGARFTSFTLLLVIASLVNAQSAPASDDEQIKALMTEYGAGKYDIAFKRCVAILKANPSNMTAHYFLGNLYLQYNKLDQAAAEYKYCLSAGPNSPEAQSAQQGLQAVEERKKVPPTLVDTPLETPVDVKTQEQIDRLKKEAEDQISIKQRILDTNLGRAEQEMRDQVPRYRVGGQQGYIAWKEQEAELLKERQGKINRFKEQFAREKKEINDACDKRCNDLIEAQKNIQKRKAAGK